MKFLVTHLPAQPWKNGGGLTREIAVMPPGAGVEGFTWRVSIAEIAEDGPFSAFPGIDRQILLLAGAGARLRSEAEGMDHLLQEPLVPFAFAGEAAVTASLLDGPSQDLNVMTRRGVMRAEVQIVRNSLPIVEIEACDGLVLLAVQGSWRTGAPPSMTLTAGEGAVLLEGTAGLGIEGTAPDGALVAVRLVACGPRPGSAVRRS
jgi:environmental stress-induced protein Ves